MITHEIPQPVRRIDTGAGLPALPIGPLAPLGIDCLSQKTLRGDSMNRGVAFNV